MAPKAAARALPRFAAALLLLAAAVMVQLETAAADDAPTDCKALDATCREDTDCKTCLEATTVNTAGFEECVANYGFGEDVCVNQSSNWCCWNEALDIDCLANVAFVNLSECQLEIGVDGGECTVLNCDAVDANTPTMQPTEAGTGTTTETDAPAAPADAADATAAPTDTDDAGAAADAESSAGRPVPSLLARTAGSSKAGFLGAVGLSAVVAVVAAAAFV